MSPCSILPPQLEALLPGLEEADRSALLGLMTPRKLSPSDCLVSEGDNSSSVFLLIEGKLEIFGSVGKARSLFLGYLHPGQFVGDAAALIGEVHSCAVRAVLPSIVGEIDTLAFLANLRRNTSLALHVARSLAKGLIHADNQRLELLAADLPTRLINFLYESHATVEENDLFISPAPTHADLSRSLGATRESLTRAIGLLRATGEIEVRDQGWIVKRGPDLRAPHGSA